MKHAWTVGLVALLVLGSAARGDWVPNHDDPRLATNHKMHWPQMPDPNGWDVSFYSSRMVENPLGGSYLASAWPSGDDWRCGGTGPVTDIHFWVSMQGDTLPSNPDGDVPFQITFLRARIREDVPAGEGEYAYSTPGNPLWSAEFSLPGQHEVSHWETHEQGWFVPVSEEAFPGDHHHVYQVNILDTSVSGTAPFVQEEGQIYWLQIELEAEGVDENGRPVPVSLGWKTALPDLKFMDDATYYYQTSDPYGPNIQEHRRLVIEGQPRDLAFVITPEPATLGLLALGGLGVALRRRGRRGCRQGSSFKGDPNALAPKPPRRQIRLGRPAEGGHETPDAGGAPWEQTRHRTGVVQGQDGAENWEGQAMIRAKGMARAAVVAAAVCVALVSAASAAVNIETVPVANTGNTGELSGAGAGGLWGPDRICGAVDYEYNIGTYEVTAGQYTAFLNAVAATDTYGLYNTDMWSSDRGCKIERTDTGGAFSYSVATDWANRPVNYASFWDACRFANWLHNGQPTGLQDATTTEDGAYTLNGYNGMDGRDIQRNDDWTWAVTSEDEWYKAAYHKNDGDTGNYFDYPTASDSVPSNLLVDPDPGNNANFYGSDFTIGSPYYRTPVGEFENSESPYDTFDQGGNVFEWDEAIVSQGADWSKRGLRGGSFIGLDVSLLHAASRYSFSPSLEDYDVGFRVVAVPEPATLGLLALGACGLLARRRR